MLTPLPQAVNRRYFLRAAGVTLALPLLESLSTRVLGAGLAVGSKTGAAIGSARPKRLVCVGNMFGFYPPEFHPKQAGRDYELPILLQPLAPVPKPEPPIPEPTNTNLVSDLPVLYDLIALALQTDSTRIATLEIGNGFEGGPLGIKKGYHALTHHGQVADTIETLLKLERYQVEQFARFLGKMKSIQDGDRSLFEHTMIVFGSGMGNANAHTNTNLPVLLAGGGFRHGEHRAYPEKGVGRVPLSNLYLSLLHRFGVEAERFGISTGTLRDLETA